MRQWLHTDCFGGGDGLRDAPKWVAMWNVNTAGCHVARGTLRRSSLRGEVFSEQTYDGDRAGGQPFRLGPTAMTKYFAGTVPALRMPCMCMLAA